MQTKILSYEQVPKKAGGHFWKFTLADGNAYTVFDATQAGAFISAVGMEGEAQVKEEQKGQYTNRYLNAFTPSNGAPKADFPPNVPAAPAAPQQSAPSDRDAQIVRQSAYKAATELYGRLFTGIRTDEDGFGILDAIRSLTDELTAYGLTGRWPNQAVEKPAEDKVPWE